MAESNDDSWAVAAGALLLNSTDLDQSAEVLSLALARAAPGSSESTDLLLEADIPPDLFEEMRSLLPRDPEQARQACSLGVAWVRGRKSGETHPGDWEPVVSGDDLDPGDFPRMTGETMIALIGAAKSRIDIATAYVDRGGVKIIQTSLQAALERGVRVRFLCVGELERDNAANLLGEGLDRRAADCLQVERLGIEGGFPHLKVMTVDSTTAYIGSANLTGAGLDTNLELGALVSGKRVQVLEAFIDHLLGSQRADGEESDEGT